MFRAALLAQYRGEAQVTAQCVVAALLHTDGVARICAARGIDAARLLEAIDAGDEPSFETAHPHTDNVELRPLEAHLAPLFKGLIEQHGQLAIGPVDLLREVLRADRAMAERLAAAGLVLQNDDGDQPPPNAR